MKRCKTHGYFVGAQCPACDADESPTHDWGDFTKADLIDLADSYEISVAKSATKAKLIDALEAADIEPGDAAE